jgi:hypothetical protein
MRALVLAVTAVVAVGFATPGFAQKSAHAQMEEMKAKDPQGFSACQSLASQRGYRLGQQDDYEAQALMNFISGCLMGRQR